MFQTQEYELLDFGGGRKLERFAGCVTDRPSPPAFRFTPRSHGLWRSADLYFKEDASKGNQDALGVRGCWQPRTETGAKLLESGWTLQYEKPDFSLELKGSPFGHLGVFPEQAPNWDRLYSLCLDGNRRLGRPLRVLNLFAYTGGSTLACAAAGAEVIHLDAARNIVGQARRNAELSGLAGAPIRWITDDAIKYTKREIKREKKFDGIILDPPAYGHGAHGEVWRLTHDLPKLLELLLALIDQQYPFILLTCHSPGFDASRLQTLLSRLFTLKTETAIDAGSMSIPSAAGVTLSSGAFALMRPVNVNWE